MLNEFLVLEPAGALATGLPVQDPASDLPELAVGLLGLEPLPPLLEVPTSGGSAIADDFAGADSRSSAPLPLLTEELAINSAGDALLDRRTLTQRWDSALDQLDDFAQFPTSAQALAVAFGKREQGPHAARIIDQILSGERLPQLRVLPLAQLSAQGAYATKTQTIFIAKELLAHPEQSIRVLLEELGHFIDDQINTVDTPGDEGAVFAALVQGDRLTVDELATLQAEDDSAVLRLDNQLLHIEKADLGPGTLTVDPTGQITVEFIADSGAYQGQLGIFSLAGMEGLPSGSPEFIREAARRALSNSTEGYVVIDDSTEGAVLTGDLGEANWNAGAPTGSKTFAFAPGSAIAVMLVPHGTLPAVFENPTAEGSLRPLFSIASANPDGRIQMGQVSPGTYAMEDMRLDEKSDGDFNDLIFSIQGATGTVESITTLGANQLIWLETPLGQQLFLASNNPLFPAPDPSNIQVSIPGGVAKFTATSTEAEIAASGAARITIGTQTIYIGTNQVSGINQNPIAALFDSANPANNWIRTDYEVTGADGRGVGIAWDGANLYAVFTVDGTQGTAAEDFRRATTGAEQTWLRSYGAGGGSKVSVLGRIDPVTGELLDAAYLSAILSNGNSNSLSVTGLSTNASGNLVVNAQSFFSPRRPDGSALTQVTPGSSPFPYTLEITPDLKRVVTTSAPGWA